MGDCHAHSTCSIPIGRGSGLLLRSAIALGVVRAVWGVIILILARRHSRRREANETHHTANKTPLRRRLIILEKIFWLLDVGCQ